MDIVLFMRKEEDTQKNPLQEEGPPRKRNKFNEDQEVEEPLRNAWSGQVCTQTHLARREGLI